jgi:hypothetical protein
LRQYGYPSERELRREAQGLAGASVPTIRSVSRPYQQQMQSTRDFLAAVQSALADTSGAVGSGYDQAISQSQGVDQAAQARLAALGLGSAGAGVQAAVGARGDSATQNLISDAASAKNYAAQLPAVAAGSASRQNAGLQKNLLDALSNRRDSLSQAFFQALQQVQSQALQQAGMVQSGQQFQQQMAQSNAQFAQNFGLQQQQYNEGVREFNVGQAASAKQQAWSNKLDVAKFEADTGYNPITGKAVPGASSALSKFSPAELRAQAKLAAPLLNPTSSSNTSQTTKGGSGSTTTSKKVVQHGPPAPVQGIPFAQFLGQLTDAGVDPTLALQMAAGLYQRYASSQATLAQLNAIGAMDSRSRVTMRNAAQKIGLPVFANAQSAYASYVLYAQQNGLMPHYYRSGGGGGGHGH